MKSGGGGDPQLNLPAGFRFHPTDDELVVHYLCRRCAGQNIAAPIIAELDLYKFDPWNLPGMALYGDKEWYFFSPRDRKYPNGSRPNRAAGTGYWKATGADKPVGKPKALGIKKALVFYAGKAPRGVKTNWIMHEYRLANVDRSSSAAKKNNLRLDDWVLCRIYNKKGTTLERHCSSYGNGSPAQFSGAGEDRKPVVAVLGVHADAGMNISSSEHEEVKSEPKWDYGMGVNPVESVQMSYYMDGFQGHDDDDDPFRTQIMQYDQEQLCLPQDVFGCLQKPL